MKKYLAITLCLLTIVTWVEAPQARPAVVDLVFPPLADGILSFDGDVDVQPFGIGFLGQSDFFNRKAFPRKAPFSGKDSMGLQSLLSGEEWYVFWSFFSTSVLSDIALTGDLEWMSSSLHPETRERTEAKGYSLVRWDYVWAWEMSTYEVEYRYIEKDVEHGIDAAWRSDYGGIEIWRKWTFGAAGVKAALSVYWNHIDKEPIWPPISPIPGGVPLDIAPLSWPHFRLANARGLSESSLEPEAGKRKKPWMETVVAALSYSSPTWEVTLSSSYPSIKDRLKPGKGTISFYYGLDVSYHPTRAITITPSLSFSKEKYRPSSVRTKTYSAALSFTTLRWFKVFDFTAYGSYAKTRGGGGVVDTRVIDAMASLIWHLGEFPLGKATLSFDVTYYRCLDVLYPGRSNDELSGMLFLKIPSLPF